MLALRAEVALSAVRILTSRMCPAGGIIGEGLLTHCRLRLQRDTLADEGLLQRRLYLSVSGSACLALTELLLVEAPVQRCRRLRLQRVSGRHRGVGGLRGEAARTSGRLVRAT